MPLLSSNKTYLTGILVLSYYLRVRSSDGDLIWGIQKPSLKMVIISIIMKIHFSSSSSKICKGEIFIHSKILVMNSLSSHLKIRDFKASHKIAHLNQRASNLSQILTFISRRHNHSSRKLIMKSKQINVLIDYHKMNWLTTKTLRRFNQQWSNK